MLINRHYRDPFDAEPMAWALAAAVAIGVIAAYAKGGDPDTRPVVYAYTAHGCQPCNFLHRDVDAGKLAGFRVEFRDPPEWCETVPCLHYRAANGKWKLFRGWTDGSAERFTKRWEFWNRSKGGQ